MVTRFYSTTHRGFVVLLGCESQMEHDRQMTLKAEAKKVAARKKLLEVQRGALHVQMQEREKLKREVRVGQNMAMNVVPDQKKTTKGILRSTR